MNDTDTCILVLEDNSFFADALQIYLSAKGFSVDVAPDGMSGLALYCATPDRYALILSDVEMPLMNGLEFASRVRNLSPASVKRVPIVAMTGSLFADDPRVPLFDALIKKPFDLAALPQLIQRVLREAQLFR